MKPLKDYAFIRGVCHGWRGNDPETLKKEIGYAKRLHINSFRSWFSSFVWEKEPDAFLTHAQTFVRTSHENGITVMPILFNGNGLKPETLEPAWWASTGDPYVKAMVSLLKDEPGLIMWDIMNEPSCNDYLMKCAPEDRPPRLEKMNRFLKHYCDLVKALDPVNTITIGHTFADDLEPSAEWVDVISFHDYLESRPRIENAYAMAEATATKHQKPLINSELSCIGRANPYDLSIQIAMEHNMGFYVFELMIRDHWAPIHGLVYPDGTIRDPSVIAAMLGFFRNRTPNRVLADPNREGKAVVAIERLKKAMAVSTEIFAERHFSSDAVLEATEWIVNLLESSEMVAMIDPPSAKLAYYRSLPEEQRNANEICRFAYSLAQTLKDGCHIL